MDESHFNLLLRLMQNKTNIHFKREMFVSILMLYSDKLIQEWRPILVIIFYNLFINDEMNMNNIGNDYNTLANILHAKLVPKWIVDLDTQVKDSEYETQTQNQNQKEQQEYDISIVQFEISRKSKMVAKVIDSASNNCYVIDNQNSLKGFSFSNGDIKRLDVDIASNMRPVMMDADSEWVAISSRSRDVQIMNPLGTQLCKIDTGYRNNVLKLATKWGLIGVSSDTQISDIIQIYNFEQKYPNRILQLYAKVRDFVFMRDSSSMLVSLTRNDLCFWDLRSRNKYNSLYIGEMDAKEIVPMNSNKVSILDTNGRQMLYDVRYTRGEYWVIENDVNGRYLSASYDVESSMMSVIYDNKIEVYDTYLDKVFEKEQDFTSYTILASSMRANLLRIL